MMHNTNTAIKENESACALFKYLFQVLSIGFFIVKIAIQIKIYYLDKL